MVQQYTGVKLGVHARTGGNGEGSNAEALKQNEFKINVVRMKVRWMIVSAPVPGSENS